MYQQCVFLGRTTRDMKLRKTPNINSVVNFQLAVERKNGNEADFIPCVAWGDLAERFAKKVGQGSLILIDGEWRTSKIEKEEGKFDYKLQFEVKTCKWINTKDPRTEGEGETN